MAEDLYDAFHHLSDDAWRALLMRSITESTIEGLPMPGFPSAQTQALFTSLHSEKALQEAFDFFRITSEACRAVGAPLGPTTKLLDFGVGWGRIARTFMRDIPSENIFGVDVNREAVMMVRKLMPYGSYTLCRKDEPIEFSPGTFDVVVAFSVFSHLAPRAQQFWLEEFYRLLKPGGVVVITTLSSRFRGMCMAAAQNPKESDWHKALGEAVLGTYPDALSRLPNWPDDEMLYLPTGGGLAGLEASEYGWAMVPERYGRAAWKHSFDVVEFHDDEKRLEQAWFVLRRKESLSKLDLRHRMKTAVSTVTRLASDLAK